MAGKHDKVKDKDRYSIISKQMDRCCVCGRTPVHLHEIFGGPFRDKSKQDGMVIPLCPEHHNMSSRGIHIDKVLDLKMKVKAQKIWENTYGNREEFIKRYGRNYDMEDNEK